MPRVSTIVSGLILVLAAIAIWQLLFSPSTPLPREWNPTKRLHVDDPVTWLTSYKLDAAASDNALCLEVLRESETRFRALEDLEVSPQCHIRGRVELSGLGGVRLSPFETRCGTALRLKMWTQHDLQHAAQEYLGAELTGMLHFSSYNCRQIRTPSGRSGRMSTHATADAIDISGFRLADGRVLSLKEHWEREPAFFRAARDSACRWFKTTLGPDFNSLHADHFHLQNRGWGTCR